MISFSRPTIRLALLILATLTTTYAGGAAVPLFDGKTLDGWEGNRAVVWHKLDGQHALTSWTRFEEAPAKPDEK